MRYGAMAACAVALVGIGAAMINSSRFKAEAPAEAAMTEECVEGSAAAEEAPAEAAPAEEPMMAEAQEAADTAATEAAPEEGADDKGFKSTATAAGGAGVEIGTCDDAWSRLKAAGIAAEVNTAPVDATFGVKQLEMNKATDALDAVNIGKADDDTVTDLRDLRFDFVEGIPGHGVNEQKLIDELTARTEAREFGTVEFENEPIEPEVTIATIKETLVMRSSAYTSYAKGHYGRAERVHNMTKACGMIYGTVLQPGDVLSCNTLLGDRYEKYGWQPAPAVIEGGANTEDQPGGGVCQVSTTMYEAVLMGDYNIVYRQAHSSRLSYVPGGLDASINTGTIDFKWSNNTEAPVYVFTWIDKEQKRIWCEIYGLPFAADAGFDEIELISERLPDIEPTADEYITYSGLTAPYWMLKNAAKSGYAYDTFKSYKLNGVEVKREPIANTVYRMHPRRYYVWPGYVAGTPLQAEYQLPLPQKNN